MRGTESALHRGLPLGVDFGLRGPLHSKYRPEPACFPACANTTSQAVRADAAATVTAASQAPDRARKNTSGRKADRHRGGTRDPLVAGGAPATGAGDRRAELSDRTAADRLAVQCPPAGGRGARARQDPFDHHPGAGDRRPLPPHPVYPRPASRRLDRDPGVPPGQRGVHHQARTDLRQHHPGGRDQPRTRQGAERAAGGNAGTAGDHRRREPPPRRSVHGARHPESDRAGGYLSAAGGAGRPLYAQSAGHLSQSRRGTAHPAPDGPHRGPGAGRGGVAARRLPAPARPDGAHLHG